MTPCQRLKHLLYDFAEGELGEEQRNEVQSHIDECAECGGFVEKLRTLRSRLKEITPVRTSDDFILRLRARIRQEAGGQTERNHGWFGQRRWIPAVGLALLLFATGFLMVDRSAFLLPGSGPGKPALTTSQTESGTSSPVESSGFSESEQIREFEAAPEPATRQFVAAEDSLDTEEDGLEEVRSRIRAVSY